MTRVRYKLFVTLITTARNTGNIFLNILANFKMNSHLNHRFVIILKRLVNINKIDNSYFSFVQWFRQYHEKIRTPHTIITLLLLFSLMYSTYVVLAQVGETNVHKVKDQLTCIWVTENIAIKLMFPNYIKFNVLSSELWSLFWSLDNNLN